MSARGYPLCLSCRNSIHPHDRYPDTGADAGCPNTTPEGKPCACDVVREPRPPIPCPTCGRTP